MLKVGDLVKQVGYGETVVLYGSIVEVGAGECRVSWVGTLVEDLTWRRWAVPCVATESLRHLTLVGGDEKLVVLVRLFL